MPHVSVICTILNEARDIPRLVDSLLQQDPPAAEIIIVDGGSTDGSWEWLSNAAKSHPTLRPILDRTCSLKFTPGPVSKGRNVAIEAASSEIIACADAGCTYDSGWLGRLVDPIVKGEAEYTLGGSCLSLPDATIWDFASAPFLGVRLSLDASNKSCTARSMAFSRSLWRRIGGFPETVLLSEDSLFDFEARRLSPPAFPKARAMYHPRNNFSSACRQMMRYAMGDGILGLHIPRLTRNAARCIAEAAALVALPWSWIPLAFVFALELYFAFRLDWLFKWTLKPNVLLARFAFSILVPWIVTASQIRGAFTRQNPTNTQNSQA